MAESQTPAIRSTTSGIRLVLFFGSLAVLTAGVTLFFFTARTDLFFSWTVNPLLTAAFLGATYLSSSLLGYLASRQRIWACARIAVPGPLLFTLLTLAATLLHLDRFHFVSPALITRLATWLWLAIYVGVPIALILALAYQLRRPGGDPSRTATLPGWLRAYALLLALATGIAGLALFLFPRAALAYWPWLLTPLTARAVAAWLLAIGVIAVQIALENDLVRVRPGIYSLFAFAALQFVSLARYPADFAWGTASGWFYLFFLLFTLAVALGGSYLIWQLSGSHNE